jgi:hypothetical protein
MRFVIDSGIIAVYTSNNMLHRNDRRKRRIGHIYIQPLKKGWAKNLRVKKRWKKGSSEAGWTKNLRVKKRWKKGSSEAGWAKNLRVKKKGGKKVQAKQVGPNIYF